MTSRRIHCVGRVSRETQAARRCAPDYHSSDQSPSAVISGAGITQHGELRNRCALIVRPLSLAILLMGKVSAHVSREHLPGVSVVRSAPTARETFHVKHNEWLDTGLRCGGGECRDLGK